MINIFSALKKEAFREALNREITVVELADDVLKLMCLALV